MLDYPFRLYMQSQGHVRLGSLAALQDSTIAAAAIESKADTQAKFATPPYIGGNIDLNPVRSTKQMKMPDPAGVFFV